MFRRSKLGNSNNATDTCLDMNLTKRVNAKMNIHKKIFPPFWKRQKSKYYGSKGSVLSWDEASYECQSSEFRSVTIERIPTAIEYLSSSSIDRSQESDHERMESMSRYSVPMEICQKVTVMEEQNELNSREVDKCVDKYSIVDQEFEKYDGEDDDDDKSTLFGSLDNDSFMSDTALRDEINSEREKIKQSFMQEANEKSTALKQKSPFFNVSACFAPASTAYSRSYLLESPIKKPYPVRYILESDQFLRLD